MSDRKRPEDTDRNATRIRYDGRVNPQQDEVRDSHQWHVFRCELCEKVKDDSHRREPGSAICRECVREAGFEEDHQ